MKGVTYFPWCPGIPWRSYQGKLSPYVPESIFLREIGRRDPVIICNGGLLENYFALSYAEYIKSKTFYRKPVYWTGNHLYHPMVKANSLCSIVEQTVDNNILRQYGTSIIIDQENIYLNSLSKYLKYSGGRKKYNIYKNLATQIWSNSGQKLGVEYLGKLRSGDKIREEITSWGRVHKFDLNRPYVIVLPDEGYSQHKQVLIDWKESEIKALAAMLGGAGMQVIVFTDYMRRVFNNPAFFVKKNILWIWYMLGGAKGIISREIDFPIISLAYSQDCKIFGKKLKQPWRLKTNATLFNKGMLVYESRAKSYFTPYEVYERLTG